MEFLLPLLGGALGAALINGVFAFFKSKHDKRAEHDQWLRDKQVTAYAELIDSVKAATLWANDAYKIESDQTRHDEGLKVMGSLKSGHLVMLAPDATLKAADDMITSLYNFVQEVSTHGHPTGSREFRSLFDDFGAKQLVFNGRCRKDFRAPK
jgi:hypothetical protein